MNTDFVKDACGLPLKPSIIGTAQAMAASLLIPVFGQAPQDFICGIYLLIRPQTQKILSRGGTNQ